VDYGWISLWRELLKKPIWKQSTPQQRSVLITILLMANHEESEWEWKGKKFKVKPGEFVTSLESIRKNSGSGISTQNVRSALKRFEKLEFSTNKSTKMGRKVSIMNWDSYQQISMEGQQRGQQRGNKDPTPNNNVIMKQYKILLDDGSYYEVPMTLFNELDPLYPDVDTGSQLLKMSAWCIANPAKRKTKRGIKRFINAWLSRAQAEAEKNKPNPEDNKPHNPLYTGTP